MILNRQRRVPVAVKPLQDFLGSVQSALRLQGRDITVCLVSDAAMARLNRVFRRKPGPTDVLSFPANGTSAASSSSYLGDIAISPETARRNARRFARPFSEELRVLILHGVLHLLGYDHESDHGEMVRLERRLRRRLGVH
jgi:probable rRNA maturation factor